MKINTFKIKTMMADRAMTGKDLAKRSGVSRQSVSMILHRGTCEPRTAGKLAAGLGVSVADILVGE